MTLSAALDSGLAFAVVVIFFAFIYSGWMSGFTWWGTEIYKQVSWQCVCMESYYFGWGTLIGKIKVVDEIGADLFLP